MRFRLSPVPYIERFCVKLKTSRYGSFFRLYLDFAIERMLESVVFESSESIHLSKGHRVNWQSAFRFINRLALAALSSIALGTSEYAADIRKASSRYSDVLRNRGGAIGTSRDRQGLRHPCELRALGRFED